MYSRQDDPTMVVVWPLEGLGPKASFSKHHSGFVPIIDDGLNICATCNREQQSVLGLASLQVEGCVSCTPSTDFLIYARFLVILGVVVRIVDPLRRLVVAVLEHLSECASDSLTLRVAF